AEYVMETGWDAIRAHEDGLLSALVSGLSGLSGVTLHGGAADRTPTVMFSVAGRSPEQVATALAERQVAVWHGNYYAFELSRLLGLEPDGAIRAGVVHYNDREDVDRLVAGVAELVG
ncbi:MAG: hypothetical protein QOI98_1081, partial [Solirubrobacteraceae bacterium]|nr:hypothetical protein [Solirubrobacteraceae bacterium]